MLILLEIAHTDWVRVYVCERRITACHRLISESFPFELLKRIPNQDDNRKPTGWQHCAQGEVIGSRIVIAFALPTATATLQFSTYLLLDELIANVEYRLNWVLVHAYRLVVVGNLARHILLVKVQMLRK